MCFEFFADKIPWVNNFWDSFHSFIRPLGAAFLAWEGAGASDLPTKVVVFVLCGGTALASHSSKASFRLMVNHIPEPFTNIAISLIEDFFVPVGIWLVFQHPGVVVFLMVSFLAVFVWLAPKVFRLIRMQLLALRAWFEPSARSGMTSQIAAIAHPQPVRPEVWQVLHVVGAHSTILPDSHAAAIQGNIGCGIATLGMRAGAARNIKGLGNSVGYLTVCPGSLVFAARRGFGCKVHRIDLGTVHAVEWKRGIFMHRLILGTAAGNQTFLIFKNVDIRVTPAQQAAPTPPPVPVPKLAASAEIYCRTGLLSGYSYPVTAEGLFIGREPSAAQIIVESRQVSARHARIALDPGSRGVWVEDMRSTNGTYSSAGAGPWEPVRGRQLLMPGSRFAIGQGVVEFEVRQFGGQS
jgi:hypothetical protein